MALYTFAEMSKLGLDDLQTGLAETVVTISDFVGMLPVQTVAGNSYVFNREATGIDGQLIGTDGAITDSSAQAHSKIALKIRGISGQFDVLGIDLAQGSGANAGNDPVAMALKAAAKGIARKYEALALAGTVGGNDFDGLDAALADAAFASQLMDMTGTDPALTFSLIDQLLSKVQSKGRNVDFIMGNAAAENAIKALLRSSGGVTTVELNGKYFTSYDGVPFIRNDYISTDVDGVTAGNQTNIYAGNWEEGGKEGLAMVVPTGDLFRAEQPIILADKDATRFRLKMYGSLAVHNIKGIAMLKSVTV
jgi:hypothetical protein